MEVRHTCVNRRPTTLTSMIHIVCLLSMQESIELMTHAQ